MVAGTLKLRALAALVALSVGAALVLPLAPVGCVAACPTVDRYHERGELLIAANGAGVYESSPIDGPYLPFEGGTVWHFKPGLGRAPTSVQIWTSFSQHPVANLAGGYSPTAGNEAIVLSSDENEVVVKNDTCSGMYIRVRIEADVPLDAGAGDAADGG